MSVNKDTRSQKVRRNVGGTNRERCGDSPPPGPLGPRGERTGQTRAGETSRRVQAIRRLRAMRWNDKNIATYLRISRHTVRALAIRFKIPAGVCTRLGRSKRPSECYVPPLDPEKAAAITAEKQAFWRNGGRPSEWVHPYRRHAQRSA